LQHEGRCQQEVIGLN